MKYIFSEDQIRELFDKVLTWARDFCERICRHLPPEARNECIRDCQESVNELRELMHMK